MSEKIFELMQAFKTRELFQTPDALSHLFEETTFESETTFEISTKRINEELVDVTLTVHLKSRDVTKKELKYQITVGYSGIFKITGVTDVEFEKIIRTHAVLMLYPYCRSSINFVLSDSSFPTAQIPVIDFFRIYEEQKKQEAKEVQEPVLEDDKNN